MRRGSEAVYGSVDLQGPKGRKKGQVKVKRLDKIVDGRCTGI